MPKVLKTQSQGPHLINTHSLATEELPDQYIKLSIQLACHTGASNSKCQKLNLSFSFRYLVCFQDLTNCSSEKSELSLLTFPNFSYLVNHLILQILSAKTYLKSLVSSQFSHHHASTICHSIFHLKPFNCLLTVSLSSTLPFSIFYKMQSE